MKRLFKYVGIFIFLVLLTGCSVLSVKEETYSLEGHSIKMESGMKKESNSSFTNYLTGKRYIFTSLKEEFDVVKSVGLTENSPLIDYTKLVIKNNGMDKKAIEKDGLTYFTYDSTISGTKYYYMAFTFKTKDAFWLINFACTYSEKNKYEPKFKKWAKSIKFD